MQENNERNSLLNIDLGILQKALNGKIKEYGNDLLPTGVIVMWSGDLASIPQGWTLCDGKTYDAPDGTPVTTPDLRDRFIYGVSAGEDPGATGGSTTHFHDYFDVPFHTHTITDPGHDHELRGEHPGSPQSEVKDWVTGDASIYWGVSGHTYTKETGIIVDYTGSHSPETEDASSLPPYYKLAFIMKL